MLLPTDAQPCREAIAALLEKLQVDRQSYQIGKTKVSAVTPQLPCPTSCTQAGPHFPQRPTPTMLQSALGSAAKLCPLTLAWQGRGSCHSLFREFEAGHRSLLGSSRHQKMETRGGSLDKTGQLFQTHSAYRNRQVP